MEIKLRPILGAVIATGIILSTLLSGGGSVSAISLLATPTAGSPGEGKKMANGAAVMGPEPLAGPSGSAGQGPYIRLASGTFDPLADPIPISVPSELRLDSYPAEQEDYYILQFKGPIVQAWKDALENAGATIFDYIPDFAFLVKMKGTAKAAIEAMEPVRWLGIYQPGYRMEPQSMKAYILAGKTEPLTLIIIVFKGENRAQISNQLEELGGTILDATETRWKVKIKIQIDSSKIDEIANIAGVKWIEPAPAWQLHNNIARNIMGVPEVWDTHELYGTGQTVAVADTGLDQGSTAPGSLHDDFEDGRGGSRVIDIYDLVGDGADDVNSGHGTHVAGSVLGNGSRSGSNPSSYSYSDSFAGIAPEASLVFQALEDNSTGSLSGIPTDLNVLFEQARTAGGSVHTNSWGRAVAGAYDSFSEDVDEFVWDHKDFTVLFSAGNEGADSDADGVVDVISMGRPGTAKNAITVGATESDRPRAAGYRMTWGRYNPSNFSADPIESDHLSNNSAGLAAFSSRGPTLDGRFKPDVVAPGTNILSTRSSRAQTNGLWKDHNAYYAWAGGTSMSTPLVAGATALVREFYIDQGITPSAALIKATLINGAHDITPGQYGTGTAQEIPSAPRPNNVEGWGRVNVENSIFPAAPRRLYYFDETSGLSSTGNSKTYDVTINSSTEPLRVNLVWSDYPGSSVAAGGLVNDLDLIVTDPSGTAHYPNHASQRGVTQFLSYGDDIVEEAWRSNSADRGFAVRFTPTTYPMTLDKARFRLWLQNSSSYQFTVNVWDDNGVNGLPGAKIYSTGVTAVTDGWFTADIRGVTVTEGDFYIELHFTGDLSANPFLGIDTTSPVRRSYFYDGTSWSTLPYDPYPNGNWTIQAVVVSRDYNTHADRVNNVVGVDIESPNSGNYTIEIKGHNVPQGPQPYALVVSGDVSAIAPTITPTPTSTTMPTRTPRPTQTRTATPIPTPERPEFHILLPLVLRSHIGVTPPPTATSTSTASATATRRPTGTSTPTPTYTVAPPTTGPSPTPAASRTLTPTATGTCSPGSVSLDQQIYYGTDAEAIITVVDADLNTNPNSRQTVPVDVVSDSNPFPFGIQVTLKEVSNNSNRFTTAANGKNLRFCTDCESDEENAIIKVTDGDRIGAIYSDECPSLVKTATATWRESAPTPTPTATRTSTLTPTRTPTMTPTYTPTPTPTPSSYVSFDKESYYGTDAEAIITVVDADENTDPNSQQTVPVHVVSDSDQFPFGIQVTLKEVNNNSNRFTTTANGKNLGFCTDCVSDEENVIIRVADGDRIAAIYGQRTATAAWRESTPTPTPRVTATPTSTRTPSPTEGALKAIVVNSKDLSICIIDAATDTVEGCYLEPLGEGTALLDVVVTPDGRTALVSNFDGEMIYFLDLTTSTPAVLGSVNIGISAEDIALSPDGRWALITDGGGAGGGEDQIVVIDVSTRNIVHNLRGIQAQAVTIASGGETVLVADYYNDRVHVVRLTPENGRLTDTFQNIRTGDRPTNVAISPDGRTGLVANAGDDTITVLRIDGPGEAVKIGELRGLPGNPQSVVFSPDGTEAYVISTDRNPDQLYVLNVNGPGDVTDSGIDPLDLLSRVPSWYFGVDPLAVTPDGRRAYVGNPGEEGIPADKVMVIDLGNYSEAGQIPVGEYPAGIAFFTTEQ